MAPSGKGKEKAERPSLKGMKIAVAGPLSEEGWTDEKIAKWVAIRGGEFSYTMEADVTHVLTSVEAWEDRKKDKKLREAMTRGKKCAIVFAEWLEHCIEQKKKLKVDPYLLTKWQKEQHKQKRAAPAASGQEDEVDPLRFDVYRDETYFGYHITLIRNDEDSDRKKGVNEKIQLTLFESKAKPHLYYVRANYGGRKHAGKQLKWTSSETPQTFEISLVSFKKFFKRRTGIRWDERLDKDKRGTTVPGKFTYLHPTGGKPEGVVNHPLQPFDSKTTKADVAAAGNRLKRRAAESPGPSMPAASKKAKRAEPGDNEEQEQQQQPHEDDTLPAVPDPMDSDADNGAADPVAEEQQLPSLDALAAFNADDDDVAAPDPAAAEPEEHTEEQEQPPAPPPMTPEEAFAARLQREEAEAAAHFQAAAAEDEEDDDDGDDSDDSGGEIMALSRPEQL
ncbi:hypothetical protein F4780DRAFT_103471 [Xylariomycetidae sp. FL0641]|nr:hypothetical protein F4780DRAFT_103471 [Xylariomycetidae sp. FL0641]